MIFQFDSWHLFTLTEKQYAKDIIAHCNRRTGRNRFAEIGCGLGDIVLHVHYQEKYGYDADEKVLRAARFRNRMFPGKQVDFAEFHFPESELCGMHDAIIMVNWIHHIEPAMLKSKIEQYFNGSLRAGGVIVMDTVQDTSYQYNHQIRDLTHDMETIVTKLGDYERQRQVWLLEKRG